jgi:hypothetical protein
MTDDAQSQIHGPSPGQYYFGCPLSHLSASGHPIIQLAFLVTNRAGQFDKWWAGAIAPVPGNLKKLAAHAEVFGGLISVKVFSGDAQFLFGLCLLCL